MCIQLFMKTTRCINNQWQCEPGYVCCETYPSMLLLWLYTKHVCMVLAEHIVTQLTVKHMKQNYWLDHSMTKLQALLCEVKVCIQFFLFLFFLLNFNSLWQKKQWTINL